MKSFEFNTSLVREKIVFTGDGLAFGDVPPAEDGKITVRSNRIVLNLDGAGGKKEAVVIRAQTMAATLRYASRIMHSYFRNGLFLSRESSFDWLANWNAIVSSYDRSYRTGLWGSVHINGNAVFKTMNSPLVDILEKCATLSKDDYDAAMNVTESALRQIGHEMRINHETNIGAVFHDKGDSIRCGIIHRDDSADTTFSFTAKGGEREVRIVEGIRITSAFLEGIDLRYTNRRLFEKLRRREAPAVGPEANQQRRAYTRLLAVSRVIQNFEEFFDVRYRPEKPDFFRKGTR
jgi:hypothetical protein